MRGSSEPSSFGAALFCNGLSTGFPSKVLVTVVPQPEDPSGLAGSALHLPSATCRWTLFCDIHSCSSACTPVRGFALCPQVGVGHQLDGIGGYLRLFVGGRGGSRARLCGVWLE